MSDKIKVALKPEELRIGNYILKDGKLKRITSFTMIDCRCFPSHFEPIPIKPEILESVGFAIVGPRKYQLDTDLGCSFLYRDGAMFMTHEYGEIGNEIKYLHTLQNLFYALCGRELEIKL